MDGEIMSQIPPEKMSQWHVGVAAEAFAAGLFARCGLNVLVQYGANQPEFDLAVSRNGRTMNVSVKGSQDGGWGLTQSYLENANYHAAIDAWKDRHNTGTVLCLVQFDGVPLSSLPRVYLATPDEVAAHMKKSAAGRGDTILEEEKNWTARAQARGTVDRIPTEWLFSPERVAALLAR